MNRYLLAPILSLVLAVSASASHVLDCVGTVQVGTNGGSGTMIARNSTHCLVLSCQHVAVRRGYAAQVGFPGFGLVEGVVVKVDAGADLALILAATPGKVQPAKLGEAREENSPFYLMGYPQHDREHVNWQKGDAQICQKEILIVDCAPIPGMSGGPTFDSRGYLTAVVVGYALDPDMGVCIPSGEIFPFLLEFTEETDVSRIIPAVLLAAAIANAPTEIIPFPEQEPEPAVTRWYNEAEAAVDCGLIENIRRNRQRRQRRYYRPQPRVQRVEPQVSPQCPDGRCPKPDNSCPNGQCERPDRTERVDRGFRFERKTPRREFRIETGPEPTPAPKPKPEPEVEDFVLEIQVQDLYEDEDSIIVESDDQEVADVQPEYAGLGAILGAVVAAYKLYVDV